MAAITGHSDSVHSHFELSGCMQWFGSHPFRWLAAMAFTSTGSGVRAGRQRRQLGSTAALAATQAASAVPFVEAA